jgi:hypothetical protein
MSESDEHYCPNPYCDKEKLAIGEKACPECGAYVQKMDGKELAKLLQKKRALSFQQKKEPAATVSSEQDKEILFSDDMTDDQIRTLISQDMANLATHEAGTASTSGALPSNPTDQLTASGFKALKEQNKIMIRQNELIIRSLKKLAEKMDQSHH